MNRDLPETNLENLLRSLVPDAPSFALMERIDEELKLDMSWLNATARPRRQVNWLNSVGWSAVGAAAAVAVMSFLPAQPQGALQSTSSMAAVAPAPAIIAVSTDREWDVMKEEAAEEKVRRPRQQATPTLVSYRQAWLNPHSASRITVTPPDEQRLVLPVNFISEAPFSLPDLQPYRP